MRKAMTVLALAALLVGGTTMAGCASKGKKTGPAAAKGSCPGCEAGKACPGCAAKGGNGMAVCSPGHPCPMCKAVMER